MNPALGPYHVYHTYIYIYNMIIYGISPLVWNILKYVYIYTHVYRLSMYNIYVYIYIYIIWAMNHLRFRG